MNSQIIISIVLMIISLVWVNLALLQNAKAFWDSIVGVDKQLQITEICIYIWIRLIPIVILCDLFLDYKISEEAWYSLNAIFFILITGDLGHKYIHKIKK